MQRLFGVVFLVLLLFVALGASLAFPANEMERASSSLIPLSGPLDSSLCLPLPAPTGNVITVSNVSQLESAVNSASSGTTILVVDGTYNLNGVYLRFDTSNVTLRSASGNREAVILDGNYSTTEIIQIVASNVTIADLTLREAYDHPIHVMSTSSTDTNGTLIYNVHIIDPGQQAIKINPVTGGHYTDNGVIACSHIELTNTGRPHIRDNCYTGGIDAHQSRDWVIRDNLIEGFWCSTGLSEHGIHFWVTCRDPVVERNVLRNNARGIGFGLQENGSGRTYPDGPCPSAGGQYVDHYGGIIRNNFVFVNDSALFASQYKFDCGICLWQACGSRALHNTVASTQPPFSSIEWRFSRTNVDIINNLVTHNLMDRGGTVTLSGNLQNQPPSLFVDGSNGDLHLAATATNAIDQVAAPADVSDDIDGDTRPFGSTSDIGADEYDATVNDLRVTRAITGAGVLTITLSWTAPLNVLTTTLRYSGTLITDPHWNSAFLLTNTLPGNTETYTATMPYSGEIVWFALRSQDVNGGWSGLSNSVFWPHLDVYLPLVLKRG
jgi:hypothetical protein